MPGAAVPGAAARVLGEGAVLDPAAARLAVLIDPGFLVEAGWDRASRVLSLPAEHPRLGWRACPNSGCANSGCANPVYGRDQVCGRCRTGAGTPDPDTIVAAGAGPARRGEACRVDACGRERGNRRYCRGHDERLRTRRRTDPGFDERSECASLSWPHLEPE